MKALELGPLTRAKGSVRLPGSKSISNRVLLLAALAKGETGVRGLLDSDDTQVMLNALAKLGLVIGHQGQSEYLVVGAGGVPEKRGKLYLGNAGTAFRPLTAALAFAGGSYELSGVARMHERPIGDLVDALRAMGARIDFLGAKGYPPLAIHPARIAPGQTVQVRGDVSSQYLSALLMALPLAGGGSIAVEGDASSASYFLAAGAIGGGPVRVEGVGRASIQGDVRFCEVLEKMGARMAMGEDWIEASGRAPLRAFDLDLNHIPDAAMTAAVLALFADGPCILRNIASWRVKETDRIAAMAAELGKLGAGVEAGPDFLKVTPRKLKSGIAVDTYDDHRMAMSLALAAFGGIALRINDPDCVAKTFPDFFKVFGRIAR